MRTLLISMVLTVLGAIGAQASMAPPANRPVVAVSMAAATVGSQAVADFSVRQPGMQANSDWRKVRPPDRLKPDRDRVKVEIGRSDNDDRRARYWRSHHHRHHRVRYYRDGYYRDGIWYWYD